MLVEETKMMNSTAWAGVVATLLCVCTFICFADDVGSGAADGEKSGWKTVMVREEKGTCGENLSWVYSENTLTINGTGEMTDYEFGSSPWNSYLSEITAIVIEYGVTSIGERAFSYSAVKNVTIPGSVKTIGERAFCECRSLETVIISDGVPSIGNYAFSGSTVKNVTIPGSVKTIGAYAFADCHKLESIIIPDGVTSIGKFAFSKSGMKNVIIPGCVKTIGEYAFFCCESLESVIISDGVTTMESYAFSGSSVKNVAIPGSVKTIGNYAFYTCNSLESVIISDGVTSIGAYAFQSSGVKNVTIPGTVETIGGSAFSHCGSLESVFIPDSVTSIKGYAFYSSGLKNVTIPGSVKTIGQFAFSECSNLEYVFIPDSVTHIESFAFNSPLSTVFYQGTQDFLSESVYSVLDENTVKVMCVPQDYNSSTFCGVNVTSDKEICQEFQSMFSYCSKPVYFNGGLILQDRYKTGIDGCVITVCDGEIETVFAWSLCNRTSNEERICLEEECMDNKEMIDKTVSIRIKLDRAVDVKEIVIDHENSVYDELRRIMHETCGIEDDEEMMIGWQTAEEGGINEFVIYIDDEGVFKNRTTISRIIQEELKSIQYLRVKEVEISRRHVCLNEECKKDVYVEIELEDSIEEDELDVDEILAILKDKIGIDTTRIVIGWDLDESGKIIRVLIYVDDEAMADSISSQIKKFWPRAKRAQVVIKRDYLSCARMNHVGRMSGIILILYVLYVADAYVISCK